MCQPSVTTRTPKCQVQIELANRTEDSWIFVYKTGLYMTIFSSRKNYDYVKSNALYLPTYMYCVLKCIFTCSIYFTSSLNQYIQFWVEQLFPWVCWLMWKGMVPRRGRDTEIGQGKNVCRTTPNRHHWMGGGIDMISRFKQKYCAFMFL